MMRRIAWLALLPLAACSFESRRYRENPPNPWKDVRKIVILPFINASGQPFLDTDDFGQIFASEMVKFSGFEVIRPSQVLRSIPEGEKIKDVGDALKLARGMRADAILIAAVTDFDGYNPPRIGLKLVLLGTVARRVSSAEIDRITQSASWRNSPVALSSDLAGNFIGAFEEVWDAHSDVVTEQIEEYAAAQDQKDTGFPLADEFKAVVPRFMQFVSNMAIRRLIAAKNES